MTARTPTVAELADSFMREPLAETALLGFRGDLRKLITEVIETTRDMNIPGYFDHAHWDGEGMVYRDPQSTR